MFARALLGLLLTAVALPASAQQQPAASPNGPVLAVKGEGRTDVKPDYALFHVTLTTKGRTLEETARAHQERAARALSAIRALEGEGIGIERSTFRLNEFHPVVASWSPDRRRPPQPKAPEPQFSAETSFSLKASPIEALNSTISKLSASGLFEIRSVGFKVERERMALNQARRAAMLDAREQAEAYAEAGDLRLVEITEITDGEASPASHGDADMPASPYVQIIPPATVSFSASVNVTWRIAPR